MIYPGILCPVTLQISSRLIPAILRALRNCLINWDLLLISYKITEFLLFLKLKEGRLILNNLTYVETDNHLSNKV